jgi:hypothetical protein
MPKVPNPHPAPGTAAVEIYGPWLANKGDDLMLRATAERLRRSYLPAVSAAMGLEDGFARTGIYQIRWKPTASEVVSAVASGSPRAMWATLRRGAGLSLGRAAARRRGYVDGRDLIALVDCSGFAYGDQWPGKKLRAREAYFSRLRRQGAKLIMLPQALGPFVTSEVREPAQALIGTFDLVFARDSISASHVLSLGIPERKVHVCPDITHALAATPPSDTRAWASRVCIVPNRQMVNSTSQDVSARYVDFLAVVLRTVAAAGLEPAVLIHEALDHELVADVSRRSGTPARVFDEDALVSKGYLGACYANIGSRYHSLVSSLSQATPSVGTSWSHKYEALFEEYNCTDCLMSPLEESDEVERKLRAFLDPVRRQSLHQQLLPLAQQQKQKVLSMWNRIEALLTAVD